jgi:uncharacterized NAD(P)/FAD-binding protein YdhS
LEHCLKTFLVIGGGASGVLVAAQLLAHASTRQVILFERGSETGAGVAYGTEHPGHLLNVPAIGMSAFPDRPEHFVNWLADEPRWTPPGGWTPQSFVPRRLYHDYLSSLLIPYKESGSLPERLTVIRDEVVDLFETPERVDGLTEDGGRYLADAAILATGNEGPVLPTARWRHDCWSSHSGFDILSEASVAIIGTGLSMVDAVISLLDGGHFGSITAISRRGLLPQPHDASAPLEIDPAKIPFGCSLSHLTKWLRGWVRSSGGDWRGTVDGLRSYTQRLWQEFSPVDKKRFLRHARPWWDVHRHRMAPQIRGRIDAARVSGQLTVMSGRIAGLDEEDDGIRLRLVQRGTCVEQTIQAHDVIECRGHNADVSATRNPLLGKLFGRGAIRPDPFRVGIDVATNCATIDAQGKRSERIFAIGRSRPEHSGK